jgi:predicted metal-dependent phosphoesterase TrpH
MNISRRVDLHIHSTASDGQMTPSEVVQCALERHLRAISITDHDSVAAIGEAREHARGTELEVISGLELGIAHRGADVHLLGYFIDPRSGELLHALERFRRGRYRRGEKIIDKLNRLGVDLRMETVMAIAGDSPLGRPHVADAMVREEYVVSYREAFARYLGYHAPAYVPRSGASLEQAIDLIHRSGGVAVLAHPGVLNRDELIPEMVEMGLDGLEAYHYIHDPGTARRYVLLAHQHGLVFTGGSDCHGSRSGGRHLLGKVPVSYHCVTALKKRQKWLGLPSVPSP